MFRRTLIAAFAIALFAAPAFAQDAPAQDDDQTVPLSPVALPIIVDGQVINYVFVTVKVLLTPNADQIALRDKEPFFRDALVRAATRTPFVIPTDYNRIDEGRLKAQLFHDATMIAGPGKVRGVQVVSQQAQHFIHMAPPTSH